MVGRGTTDALFVVRMKEEYRDMEKKYMHFVNIDKVRINIHKIVPKKVMKWAMEKNYKSGDDGTKNQKNSKGIGVI